MNAVVLYFSGTGNTQFVAELLAANLGIECFSIEDKTSASAALTLAKTVCICYPIYGSRVPRLMREFALQHAATLEGKKLVILCTQMVFSGDGARAFTYLFPPKHFQVIYAEHIVMPNNVNNLFLTPLASEASQTKIVAKARLKVQRICDDITKGIVRLRGYNNGSRLLGLMQGVFFPSLENYGLNRVWIDDDCNNCLACVSKCPVGNLEYDSDADKVAAKGNCMFCYRCINQCPQKAIRVYLRSKVKSQYRGIEAR